MLFLSHISRVSRLLLVAGLVSFASLSQASDAQLPGKGVTVQPVQTAIAEETFQTKLVMEALRQLGYTVKPIKEVDIPAEYLALANGDATFMADSWDPLHSSFYKNAGGDKKLSRKGAYSPGALQGYLIDKKTADKYQISNIAQLKDPKLAALFDTGGNGRANLTGCNPGWGCERVIEHQLPAFGLSKTVQHDQGNYSALIADTITRYRQGKPILYYTWTPYWVSGVLKPGRDVVWLEVPFSALPDGRAQADTRLPNGKNYGFVINTQRIVANRKFVQGNPAAAKLFEIMQLPVADINTQNMAMRNGANKPEDIERHVQGWIKAHQKTFDGWLAAARAAAQK